jgi:membrane protease YdiL (CAAX protease family)
LAVGGRLRHDVLVEAPITRVTPAQPVWPLAIEQPSRRGLVRETWCVMIAFLIPGVISAIVLLVEHIQGTQTKLFPVTTTGDLVTDLFIGILSYLTVAAVVPITLLLLNRTGQGPTAVGLIGPGWRGDIVPGVGLTVAGFAGAFASVIALTPLISADRGLFNSVVIGHVPAYYITYGIVVSAVTAITEECLVNGYLLIRLDQLGWSPQRAMILSIALRTSYHVYYGLGFLFTIPFGYFFTRSFQKHRRLSRPIIGHFLYDAILVTIGVLTHR